MMRSGNPALRANTFDVPSLGASSAMTVSGTVNKTALLLALCAYSGYWAWTHPGMLRFTMVWALVGLGFTPVRAVALALLGHAAGVSFGAVGTPALAQIGAPTARTLTFGTTVRAVSLEATLRAVRRAGLEVVEVFGLRIVGDLMLDNEPKSDPDFYASWERLEVELSRREPFCRLGQSFGVVARRP